MVKEPHRREPPEYAPPGQEYAQPGRECADLGLEQQPEEPTGNHYTAPRQEKHRHEREALLRTLLLGAVTVTVAAAAVTNPGLQWKDTGAEQIQTTPIPSATPTPTAALTPEPTAEPTATPTVEPTATPMEEPEMPDIGQNYFEKNGLTVLDTAPENAPVTFITISQDDNTVYTLWDTGTLTGFKQSVTDSERDGYKTVTLQADLNLNYQADASTENDYYIVYGVQLYDLYTGRKFPTRLTLRDDGYGYSFDLPIGEKTYTIYTDATVRWYRSAWMPQTDGPEKKTSRARLKYVLQVPKEYDGLVFCNNPMTANSADNVNQNGVPNTKEVDYTEQYVLDDLSQEALAKTLFVRFGQEKSSAIS